MRVCVINPFAGTEQFGRENLQAIAAPDTEFDIVDIGDEYPLDNNQWLYFKHSCTGPTVDRAVEAERQGYDAVFISCNLDIGLYECRQLCEIPITATLEAAALTAHAMGRRFSLLSVDDQNGQIQKMMLEQYQLAQGLVSVRSFDIDASDLYLHRKAADDIRDTVLKVARRCVDEDGAEVLIAGCTLAGSVLSKAERDEPGSQPAPIIDGMLPGFKMAETMATLREAGLPPVSRLGVYQQPPVADLQKLRDFQGRPMPVWATGDRP